MRPCPMTVSTYHVALFNFCDDIFNCIPGISSHCGDITPFTYPRPMVKIHYPIWKPAQARHVGWIWKPTIHTLNGLKVGNLINNLSSFLPFVPFPIECPPFTAVLLNRSFTCLTLAQVNTMRYDLVMAPRRGIEPRTS